MSIFDEVTGFQFALMMLISGVVFGVAWFLDHKTHLQIWKKDISDGELRTHRMILYSSYGLMAALLMMAWYPLQALPFFLGCWFTRTVHEFMDELHWHLPRCTERETIIHLIMWVSIHTGTAVTFIWGFFLKYRGFTELPLWMHLSFAVIFIIYSYIGHHEIMDYKERRI